MTIAFLVLLKGLSKQELKYVINRQVIIMILLYAIIAIQLINSITGQLGVSGMLKGLFYPISFFYTCLLVPHFILKMKMESRFAHLLIYTGLCFSAYTLIYSGMMSIPSFDIPSLQTAQFIYVHSLIDSNYQGAIVSISSVMCLYMIFIKHPMKIVYLMIFSINFFNLIVLSSRASMLAVMISLFLFIFLLGSRLLRASTIAALLLIIICYPMWQGFIFSNDVLYNNVFDAERGSTGRVEIWKEVWGRVSNHIMIGMGSDKIEVEVAGYYVQSSHNSFLDFLISHGFVVLCLYVIIFIIAIVKSISTIKYEPFFFILISLLVIMNFTTHNVGGVSYIPQVLGILLGFIYIQRKPTKAAE
ncbi:O-antigen ligase family protein [Bacillus sp. B190/17]|uniref:O-antigen ligase family protein n=1 Tax=Bacillus lumedeiriae TaxID=3058829 RepID=A0ABW8IB99_9BACI